jgi:hypothetical protein
MHSHLIVVFPTVAMVAPLLEERAVTMRVHVTEEAG